MLRGPLAQDSYRPQFSGHETFPLRYGWLKKAFDAVRPTENSSGNKHVFLGDDAIARFGVGKNMVASMRHWATTTKIISDVPNSSVFKTTEFGRKIFDADGLDPFMEHPSTLWLTHWQLAAYPDKTTWFWAFNHYASTNFYRENFFKALERLVRERGWSKVASTTIKNDVACFVRTYVAQELSKSAGHDDALESPLTELGLIKAVGKRDGFRFVRGPKSNLGEGVFVYALIDFWLRFSSATTLSFEVVAYEPGAPGRVFLLDENDVVDRLSVLDEVTGGSLRWSETAGLKQIVRTVELSPQMALNYIRKDYSRTT